MSTPEKELKHCTACNQMTNHSGEKCLKHTPDTEYARNKLNKTYLRLAYGKSDIQKTKKEVDDILNEIITSRDTYWKERVGKEGKKIKKPTLTHAEIQLLDRHEREEYGEEVVGFNAGVDTLLDNLK